MYVIYTDADLVELRVEASNGVFAGVVDIYTTCEEPGALADKLSGFPINKVDVRDCELGTFRSDIAGGGVALRFYCVDVRGHAAVEVRLQADGPAERTNFAKFYIPVEAAAIGRFVQQLAVMRVEIGDEAWLEAAR